MEEKNPKILEGCKYLGNIIIRGGPQVWTNKYMGTDTPRAITFSFYVTKAEDELIVKRSVRYYYSKNISRKITDVIEFLEMWFENKPPEDLSKFYYFRMGDGKRLDNLLKKVPKLKPYVALCLL